MPGLSTEEVFGPASSASSPSKGLSTAEVFGEPVEEEKPSMIGASLKKGGKNVAAVADMVLGLPGQALAVGADIGGRASALLHGGSRSDQEWAGKAMQGLVPESLLSPVSSTLKALGFGGTEDSDVNRLMAKAMGLVSRGGDWVEEKTGKVLTRADVESLVNTTLLGLGGRGTAATLDPRLKALGQWKEDPAALKARLEAKVALDEEMAVKKAAEAPIETSTGRMIPRTDQPTAMRASTPEEMRKLEKQERKALDQKRKDVRAAFADDPAYADQLEGRADLADQARELEGRHTRPENLPPNMTRTRAPEQTAADVAPKTLTQNEFGDLSIEAPDALTSGLAKVQRGRRFDLTAEELAAVKASESSFNRPELFDQNGKILNVGKRRGQQGAIDFDELSKLNPASALASILARSPYTLRSLTYLPGNRSEFTTQMIRETLRRADITQAEKDVINPILDKAGEKITARDLMVGVRQATGDWELGKKTSEKYADYGLAEIGRKDQFSGAFDEAVDPRAFDTATAKEVRPGHWEVYDAEGEFINDLVDPSVKTQQDAVAFARRLNDRMLTPETSATTNIYQLPEHMTMLAENHFKDPRYFGHTRSFDEGGVRHVVEVQSDLAQQSGKGVPAEEVPKLVEASKNLNAQLTIMNQTDGNIFRREFADNSRKMIDALEKYNPDVKLILGDRIAKFAGREVPDPEAYLQQALDEAAHGGQWAARLVNRAVSHYQDRISAILAEHQNKLNATAIDSQLKPVLKHWPRRLIREELGNAAAEGRPTVRFATADTMAKVEGWPDAQAAWDQGGRGGRPTETYNRPEQRFAPEHQGIYDRHLKEVEGFAKKLGGVEVTDDLGHTWIEVPTIKGPKQMLGRSDPELLNAISLIGGGAALAAYLSGKDEDGNSNAPKNAALTAAVIGLGMYAKSRSPAVRDLAESAGRGVEYGLGLVSTRVGNMSQALLHRMREHERGVLTTTHDNLNAVAPFLERLAKVPDSAKEGLNAAILTNDNAAVLKAMGKLGDPELVREWKNVRGKLEELGRGLVSTGRLKELLPDYYPRVVNDLPGLLEALGTEQRSFLEKKLESARVAAMRESGRDLSPLEQSLIVNKVLRSSPTSGKPGYLKSRVIGEITPELAKFYAPAEESLPLYVRAVSREIERAKFFGDDLVRDPEGGLANIDLSIGNVVNKARLDKKLTEPQVEELRSILQSRFGPGERASSGPIQLMKNLTNVGLLGNVTSALVQGGDVAIAVAQQGFLPTVKALQQIVTNDPAKITMKDLGLINHITEEVTGGPRNAMKIGGMTLSSAKFLDKVFKYSGFTAIDQLGKSAAMNAAANRFRRLSQTESGRKVIERKYGEAYGEDFPALVKDLQSGALTENVKGLLFSELSNIQPITKLEVPQAYLDHPNGRAVYMLKTYMLKQADIIRREGIQEIKAGNVSRGTQNILRYAVALGLAGATTDYIKNWILGRENNDLDVASVTENMFKTFGWSQYVTDQVRKGKPIQAIGGTVLPPYKMWDEIVSRDPKAINYIPFFGRLIYAREMGGSEKADRAAEKRKAKEQQ